MLECDLANSGYFKVIILTSFFFKIRKLDEQVTDVGGGFQTLGPCKRIAEYFCDRKATEKRQPD